MEEHLQETYRNIDTSIPGAKLNRLLYVVAFFSGGAVMACELLGAKMIAPYYGTSLYVWTAVIGVTLAGLTTGYFAGGMISVKYPHYKTLLFVISLAALLMALMPISSRIIMEATLPLDIRTGSTLSCLLFFFPQLACFGMVSPLIIRLITDNVTKVGRFAGTIYAVSTAGGIITTFLYGFYIIPYLGLKMGAYLTSIALGLLAVLIFLISRRT